MNNLKIFLIFVENIEIYPLLLGKLMVSSKGWRIAGVIELPIARLREKAVFQYTTHPYLAIG